ncbi:IclR family transcriptional regulator [Angustibacter luteus]|uniref:IclR family transcriptional regulator n=1 Tax=Angustibacter luteus TaxID=658456 RepID=A0ABW1JEI0_9ACTN
MTEDNNRGNRSVRVALDVLEALSQLQPIGLSELTRQVRLPKSTVQRALATLADAGWIESDSAGRWVVGTRAFIVGSTVGERGGLRQAALPHMNALAADVGETIHLMVLDGEQVVLIERIDSRHALRAFSPLGSQAPLHASSNGKAFLASLPAEDVERYLSHSLSPTTSRSITKPDTLRKELERVRARGYAVSDEELMDGVVSVAAAIHPPGPRPAASLSISAPASRMPARLRTAYGEKVRATADAIAASLPRVGL